jgi:hypothetical protein
LPRTKLDIEKFKKQLDYNDGDATYDTKDCGNDAESKGSESVNTIDKNTKIFIRSVSMKAGPYQLSQTHSNFNTALVTTRNLELDVNN